MRGQYLDGHGAVESGIGGPIHLAHSASADLGGDAVGADGSASSE